MRKADERLLTLAANLSAANARLIGEVDNLRGLFGSLVEQNGLWIEKFSRALELLEDAYYNGDIAPEVDQEVEAFLHSLGAVPAE